MGAAGSEAKGLSIEAKVICAVLGIAVPIGGFALGAVFAMFIEYAQLGYGLVVGVQVAGWFYPFLLYAMISVALVLGDLQRFGGLYPIRFGLSTGVILALHYTAIMVVPLFVMRDVLHETVLPLLLIPPIYLGLWLKAREKFGWRPPLVVTGVLVGLAGAALTLGVIPANAVYVALACTPFWTLTVSVALVLWLRKHVPVKSMPGATAFAIRGSWFVLYGLAWWLAVSRWRELAAVLPQHAR